MYRTKRSGILPSSHAGLYSFLTMSWMTPLMWKAFKQGLVVSDLWELDVSLEKFMNEHEK